MASPVTVGGKGCPISRVITTLQKSSSFGEFHEKWSDLARELETPHERIKKLRNDQLVNKLTLSDALHEILEEWVARQGKEASLQKVIMAVEQIGIKECADGLRIEFGKRCLLRGSSLKGTLPHRLAYYINRKLVTRNVISNKIFERKSSDILLFTGFERHELSGLVTGTTFSSNEQLLSGAKINQGSTGILSQPHHFGIICEKSDHPVHWIHRGNDSRLKWMRSSGKMAAIREFIDEGQDHINEETFPLTPNSNFNQSICISDSPGMGKSVLLSEIGRKLRELYPNKSIIFVEARVLVQLVKQSKANETIAAVSETLQNMDIEMTSPEKTAKVSSIGFEISVELLIDGFDEVDAADSDFANLILRTINISFQQIRIWVTSRPHFLHDLENILGNPGYTILPFTKDDQINFLKSFWSELVANLDQQRLMQFGLKCLNSLEQALRSDENDIAGIPLQCLLIGEVFADGALDFAQEHDSAANCLDEIGIASITNLYLYQNLYGADAGGSRSSKPLNEKEIMDMHAQLSLEILFPNEYSKLNSLFAPIQRNEILRIGLLEAVEKEHIRFIHMTFAEYFISWFVLDRLVRATLWNEQLSSFLFDAVLKCRWAGYDWIHVLGSTTPYKFENHVMAYFLNAQMVENQFTPIESLNVIKESSKGEEILYQMVYACLRGDFLHIFNFLQTTNLFDIYEQKFFDRDLLLVSVAYSRFLAETCIMLYSKHRSYELSLKIEALRVAVYYGEFSTMEFIMKDNGLYEIRSEELKGETKWLLHDCCRNSTKNTERRIENKIQIIRNLVQINPKFLEIRDATGHTPLLVNPNNVRVRLLDEMVKLGSNIFAVNNLHNTVLHTVVENSHQEVEPFIMNIPSETLKKLLFMKNKEGNIPFVILLKRHDLSFIRRVCTTAGVDFSTDADTCYSVLVVAVENFADPNAIHKIIQLGEDACWKKGPMGVTVLHLAAKIGNSEATKLFLDNGKLDANCKDDNGLAPMDCVFSDGGGARQGGNVFAICSALLERRGKLAKGPILDASGRIMNCADEHKVELLRQLLQLLYDKLFAEWLSRGERNSNKTDFQSIIDLCLKCGASEVNEVVTDAENVSMMHLAVQIEDERTVQLLLNVKGSGINVSTKRSYTPLLYSAFARDKDISIQIIQHLIGNGAEIYTRNNSGCTFLHLFLTLSKPTTTQFHNLVKCLQNNYDNNSLSRLFNMKCGENLTTAIHEAVLHLEIDQETLLLLHFSGVNFNALDRDGNDILTYAVWGGRSDRILTTLSVLTQVGHVIGHSTQFDQLNSIMQPTSDYDIPFHRELKDAYVHYLLPTTFITEDDTFAHILLRKMAGTSQQPTPKYTTLHLAALATNKKFAIKVIEKLISDGVDVYAKDNGHRTFLHLFITTTKPSPSELHSISKILVDANAADLFHTAGGRDATTPLHEAMLNTEMGVETLFLLLLNGVDFHAVDSDGNSVWTYAVWGRRSEKFMKFLASIPGLKPKPVETTGHIPEIDCYWDWETVLRDAAQHEMDGIDVVQKCKLLVSWGADVNSTSTNDSMNTPIQFAAIGGSLKVIKWMIDNGADPSVKNKENHIFLHTYLLRKPAPTPSQFHELSEYLLTGDYSSLFNIPGGNLKYTPMHLAILNIEMDEMTLKLLHGSDVDFQALDIGDHFLLSYAIIGRRSIQIIDALIHNHGVDWKVLSKFGNSLLHYSAKQGNFESLQYLLNLEGPDVNGVDADGDTPLHCAVQQQETEDDAVPGSYEIVKICRLLIENGADAGISNNAGHTPFAIVTKNYKGLDREEFIQLLTNTNNTGRNGVKAKYPSSLSSVHSLPPPSTSNLDKI